jgi:hypothetical protein
MILPSPEIPTYSWQDGLIESSNIKQAMSYEKIKNKNQKAMHTSSFNHCAH